jgi:hypothetical protein
MGDSTQRVRIGEVRSKVGDVGSPTRQSQLRFDEITSRFERFAANAFEVEFLDQLTTEMVDRFVRAKGTTASEPAIVTMHIRRAALRLLFRIARLHFDYEGDPTLDLWLPPRTVLQTRPLEEDEVVLGHSYSMKTFSETRHPAAWALGEATATTAELPYIAISDLDLDNSNGPRVWLHGSSKRVERWGFLDDWGATQVEQRAKAIKRTTDRLIYNGKGNKFAAQVSCCNAINETFARCGLDKEPDVRPASLAAYAGRVVLEETDSIEMVARRLGFRSLDAAAAFINHNW